MEKIILTPQALKSSTNNNQLSLSHSAGKGHIQWACLESGVQLLSLDYIPQQPMTMEFMPPFKPLGFGFYLSGHSQARIEGQKEGISTRPGVSSFGYYQTKPAGLTELVEAERIMRVSIFMDLEHLYSYAGEQINCIETQLQNQLNGTFLSDDHITKAMCAAIIQILNCPYQGVPRKFFLESKVLELVAYKIGQIETVESQKLQHKPLLSSDVERVLEAARLLTCDLENPPDMTTLAHSVGLSRRSLYRHFKKVHGIPPFDYLRNHKLKTAMELLQTGKVSVSEAGFSAGYSNLSYFTKAFKSMFGVLPNELLNHSIRNYPVLTRSCK